MDFPPVGGRLKPFPKERARSINLYHRRPEYVKEREKTQSRHSRGSNRESIFLIKLMWRLDDLTGRLGSRLRGNLHELMLTKGDENNLFSSCPRL
jgi:hypothetical protein